MTLYVIKKPTIQQTPAPEAATPAQQEKDQVVQLNKQVLNDPGEKKVVIDGPLSTIYTNALNAVYATEASAALVSTAIEIATADEATLAEMGLDFPEKKSLYVDNNNQISSPNDRDLYVYSASADDMSEEDARKAYKRLKVANESYKVVLALEHNGNLSSGASRLMTMALNAGFETTCIRKKVVEQVVSKLG